MFIYFCVCGWGTSTGRNSLMMWCMLLKITCISLTFSWYCCARKHGSLQEHPRYLAGIHNQQLDELVEVEQEGVVESFKCFNPVCNTIHRDFKTMTSTRRLLLSSSPYSCGTPKSVSERLCSRSFSVLN